MDCKCRQVEGQEYMCKCVASGTLGMLPASLDFTAPVGKSLPAASVSPAKVQPVKPVPSNALVSTPATTATPAVSPEGKDTGTTTATGKEIYEGPKGGTYHYSASGKKVYERKKK